MSLDKPVHRLQIWIELNFRPYSGPTWWLAPVPDGKLSTRDRKCFKVNLFVLGTPSCCHDYSVGFHHWLTIPWKLCSFWQLSCFVAPTSALSPAGWSWSRAPHSLQHGLPSLSMYTTTLILHTTWQAIPQPRKDPLFSTVRQTFDKYFLNTYYVFGTLLGITTVNRWKSLPSRTDIPRRRQENLQISKELFNKWFSSNEQDHKKSKVSLENRE